MYVFISSWLLSLRFVNTHSTHTADKNLIWFGEVLKNIILHHIIIIICMKLGIHLVLYIVISEWIEWKNYFACMYQWYSVATLSLNCFSLLKQYKITSCEVNWSNSTQCTFGIEIWNKFVWKFVLKCETNLFKFNYWLRQIYLYYTLFNVKLTASLWMTLHNGYHIQGLN